MSSYFTLQLDTTSPIVAIYAPQNVDTNHPAEIQIDGGETLDTFQSIYIIDSQGKRHDLIFEYRGTYFDGIVNFGDIGAGVCTIYAQVRDEVFNLSNLASASINVLTTNSSTQLFMGITDHNENNVSLSDTTRNISLVDQNYARNMAIIDTSRTIVLSDKTNNMDLSDTTRKIVLSEEGI